MVQRNKITDIINLPYTSHGVHRKELSLDNYYFLYIFIKLQKPPTSILLYALII